MLVFTFVLEIGETSSMLFVKHMKQAAADFGCTVEFNFIDSSEQGEKTFGQAVTSAQNSEIQRHVPTLTARTPE